MRNRLRKAKQMVQIDSSWLTLRAGGEAVGGCILFSPRTTVHDGYWGGLCRGDGTDAGLLEGKGRKVRSPCKAVHWPDLSQIGF